MATKTKKSNSNKKKKPVTKKAIQKNKSVIKKTKTAQKKKTKVASKKKPASKTAAKKKTVTKKKQASKTAAKKKPVIKTKAATQKKTTKIKKSTTPKKTDSKTRKTKTVATISDTQKKVVKKAAEKTVSKKSAVKKTKKIKEINYDDLQINENANSVAGPLEFTPYNNIAEEYMSDQQLQHFESILNNWREQLMADVDTTVGHLQKDGIAYADPLDRAAQEEGFNLELRTRDRERKLLKKIEQALDWISEGSYGFCEDCGAEIGIRRLEARPTAAKCIDCKTFSEIREKQIGR